MKQRAYLGAIADGVTVGAVHPPVAATPIPWNRKRFVGLLQRGHWQAAVLCSKYNAPPLIRGK